MISEEVGGLAALRAQAQGQTMKAIAFVFLNHELFRLVTIAGCTDCHAPQDAHGQPLPNMDFGGGLILEGPWGRVASANITPDPSGIPYYDQAMFTQAIRTGYVKARKLSQIMPWHTYRGLTDEDITSVFAYIKTLKPVRHHVDNTEPPTYCKVCRQYHGGGELN